MATKKDPTFNDRMVRRSTQDFIVQNSYQPEKSSGFEIDPNANRKSPLDGQHRSKKSLVKLLARHYHLIDNIFFIRVVVYCL